MDPIKSRCAYFFIQIYVCISIFVVTTMIYVCISIFLQVPFLSEACCMWKSSLNIIVKILEGIYIGLVNIIG